MYIFWDGYCTMKLSHRSNPCYLFFKKWKPKLSNKWSIITTQDIVQQCNSYSSYIAFLDILSLITVGLYRHPVP